MIKLFLLLILLPLFAHADCTLPAGVEGQMRLSAGTGAVEYCNGSNWYDMIITSTPTPCSQDGKIEKIGSDLTQCTGGSLFTMSGPSLGVSCPAASAGMIVYDGSLKVPKWCDGANWHYVGNGRDSEIIFNYAYLTQSSADVSTATNFVLLGPEYSNKYILVGLAARTATARTVSSVKLDGVTMTPLYFTNSATGLVGFYLLPKTAESANLQYTFSGVVLDTFLSVYSLRNLVSQTPVATYSFAHGATGTSITGTTGSLALAISLSEYSAAGGTFTWNGLTSGTSISNPDGASFQFFNDAAKFYSAGATDLVTLIFSPARTSNTGAIIILK